MLFIYYIICFNHISLSTVTVLIILILHLKTLYIYIIERWKELSKESYFTLIVDQFNVNKSSNLLKKSDI